MSITKRGNRFRAVLKSGRDYVGSKTFATKREATAWLRREQALLAGGMDPRAGQVRVRLVLTDWLQVRKTTVAVNTYQADADLARLMPSWLQAMNIGVVGERELAKSYESLLASGLAEASVRRYRSSLSAMFGWAVREKMIAANPVLASRVPRSSAQRDEMRPFHEEELEDAWRGWRCHDEHLADVMLFLGWTGLRWGEARALVVGDLLEVPSPGLMVSRSAPEGVGTKSTKGRRSRRVPLADRVLPMVRAWAVGKGPDELLVTTSREARLHRTAVLRTLKWSETGKGRRIHDLRHTAACLWLARGVDAGTVQQWLGHESIGTTNRYLHFLGTAADLAGLERLNSARGYQGGTKRRKRRRAD